MFYVPKKAIYKAVSRRKFLEVGRRGIASLGVGSLVVGLSNSYQPVRSGTGRFHQMMRKWRAIRRLEVGLHVGKYATHRLRSGNKIKDFYDLDRY